ncbi:MAG TPA: ATP-binding protein [Gemmatimonadales bacterium]|jgi:signal transduction histidine kinase
MKSFSLVRTLAVRYAMTMALALLAVGVWAYRGLRHTLLRQLDQSLQVTFELQARDLGDRGSLLMLHDGPAAEAQFLRDINRLVVVRDSTGRVLQGNTILARSLPLDSTSLHRALAGQRTFHTDTWREQEIRSITGPTLGATRGPAAAFQVTASLTPLQQESQKVLYRILVTALIGAIASLLGAGWLATSAMKPVETIARQARAIQGGTLGQRITVHADVLELRGLIDVLNRMLERLDRATHWHRRIIRDLSHDLRTPIAAMRAGVEVTLWGDRKPDRYRQVLASTLEDIDRLTLIADALSLLGRLESGELKAELTTHDLRQVGSQAVAKAQGRVGSESIRYGPPSDPIPVRMDARLVGLVLDQLLDNAVRYTSPGTGIDVAVGSRDGTATLSVEDEGPGVADEVLPHLFERFYRADSARGREAGPGLGLTLAAAIVELHDGRISARRGRRGGLRVEIELPCELQVEGAPALAPVVEEIVKLG